MSDIRIQKQNETYLKLESDRSIAHELKEEFSFFVPGHKHMPKFKMGVWDGKISLYNLNTRQLGVGIYDQLQKFCVDRGYELELKPGTYGSPEDKEKVSREDFDKFVSGLGLPEHFERREYQIDCAYESIVNRRQISLVSTGGGKSLIIYIIARYMVDVLQEKVLLVVPTVQLVHQMTGDMVSYGYSEDYIHKIMAGAEKDTDKFLVITTWQSMSRIEADSYFHDIGCIITDEVHLGKATEVSRVSERCINAAWKLGFTGSLDNSKTNEMIIRSLFGPVKRYTTTKALMDDGTLAEINLRCLSFRYSPDTIKITKHLDYQGEIEFLVSHTKRNRFIRNLALAQTGNTLVLYTLVEKHGQVIYDMIKEKSGDRPVFFIHGGVDAEDRDQVRHITEASDNAIIVASVGTFSTGTNIKKLNTLIFASPTKSVIRVLQSVGRGLRKIDGKERCTIFDLSDKINNSKTKPNHTYRHFVDRLGIYSKEQFEYKITEIELE